MKSHSGLYIALAILAVLGVTFALWATGRISLPGSGPGAAAAASATPPPASVSVAPALEKRVTEWDEFSGRVQAIDHVEIRPQVSGIIEEVHFADGQLVKKGDLLFLIDPRPFEAELARTQAVLAGAQARVALMKTNLDRSTKLIATHAIAQSDLDHDNDALLEANATLQQADAAVQAAQLNLNYTSITAPVTGRVSRAEITAGNWIGTGLTAPVLTTVVSVSPVYVEFEVDEQTYLKYSENGATGNTGIDHIPVEMGLANEDGYPHQGRIESIDNQLDTSSGTIRVRAIFDNPTGALTPGLYAKVRTGGSAPETAILVDDEAVGTDQDKKFVMVIDSGNKATYRAVTLGPMVDGLRIIRSGLSKGERIVVDGLQRVQPNAIVAPVDVKMDSTPEKAPSEVATAAAK